MFRGIKFMVTICGVGSTGWTCFEHAEKVVVESPPSTGFVIDSYTDHELLRKPPVRRRRRVVKRGGDA